MAEKKSERWPLRELENADAALQSREKREAELETRVEQAEARAEEWEVRAKEQDRQKGEVLARAEAAEAALQEAQESYARGWNRQNKRAREAEQVIARVREWAANQQALSPFHHNSIARRAAGQEVLSLLPPDEGREDRRGISTD